MSYGLVERHFRRRRMIEFDQRLVEPALIGLKV